MPAKNIHHQWPWTVLYRFCPVWRLRLLMYPLILLCMLFAYNSLQVPSMVRSFTKLSVREGQHCMYGCSSNPLHLPCSGFMLASVHILLDLSLAVRRGAARDGNVGDEGPNVNAKRPTDFQAKPTTLRPASPTFWTGFERHQTLPCSLSTSTLGREREHGRLLGGALCGNSYPSQRCYPDKIATPPPSLHTKLLEVSGSGPVDRPPLAIHHDAMKLVVGPARVGMPAECWGTGATTIAPPPRLGSE